MSKRYKGKDAHYRLQIKKDGEWQDLGLVASAEMDNKNVDDTTTTNFDEKYIHKNNDKNDLDSNYKTDIKTTDLTFQTSTLGTTPKIIFKNTDTSTQDLAKIYLNTQEANKSTLYFVLGDVKNCMWLTHDGDLHIGNKISIYSTPNSTHKDEQTNLIIRPNEISFASFDKLSALSYVNGGTGSTDWFKLALGNEGNEPLEFNWVDGDGNIVDNRKGWLRYPGAERHKDPQLIWSSELDTRLSSELTQRTDDLIFQDTTDKGIKWQNKTDTACIYTELADNDLSLVLEVKDGGNETIVFRGAANGQSSKNVTVNMGTLTADQDIVATNSFKLGNNATISYNSADQCIDFLF